MKILKQLLLTAAFIFCVSMSASAQNKDGKNPPKKIDPPVVVVKDKEKPKNDKPKDDRNNDNRGKKPQAFIFDTENIIKIGFV